MSESVPYCHIGKSRIPALSMLFNEKRSAAPGKGKNAGDRQDLRRRFYGCLVRLGRAGTMKIS